MWEKRVPPSTASYDSAIRSLRAGHGWETASALMQEMRFHQLDPDLSTWSAVLCVRHSEHPWQHALGLLRQMPMLGFQPDRLNYRDAIRAASQHQAWSIALGLLREAQQAAQSGRDAHSYSLVVAACGRADQAELSVQLLRELAEIFECQDDVGSE